MNKSNNRCDYVCNKFFAKGEISDIKKLKELMFCENAELAPTHEKLFNQFNHPANPSRRGCGKRWDNPHGPRSHQSRMANPKITRNLVDETQAASDLAEDHRRVVPAEAERIAHH